MQEIGDSYNKGNDCTDCLNHYYYWWGSTRKIGCMRCNEDKECLFMENYPIYPQTEDGFYILIG